MGKGKGKIANKFYLSLTAWVVEKQGPRSVRKTKVVSFAP